MPNVLPRIETMKDRLIVALDVDSIKEAEQIVQRLGREVGVYKVGKQLFMHAGPDVVRMIHKRGGAVFLDLKFHDIPNTVAKAGIEAARLGVKFFDLHASGSGEMMERTLTEVTKVCRRDGLRRPKILAVTVLTSLRKADLKRVGLNVEVEDQVVRLARLANKSGMDGVVASPLEIARIRRACGRGFLIVTPGVRPPAASRDDQKRVMTPAEAVQAGADYLVIGRPILAAADPLVVVREIVADMSRGYVAGRLRTRA